MWLVIVVVIAIVVILVIKGNSSNKEDQNMYTIEKLEAMDDDELENLHFWVAMAIIKGKKDLGYVPDMYRKYGKTWQEVERLNKLILEVKKERELMWR